MHTTPYFDRTRNPKAGHVSLDIAQEALAHAVERTQNEQGRLTIWGWSKTQQAYIRVVLVDDGRAILNAFVDSAFTKKREKP